MNFYVSRYPTIPVASWMAQWLKKKKKNPPVNAGDVGGFNPWVMKIPLEKEMVTHSVFLPLKSHGQRSLEDYNQRGHRRVGCNLVTVLGEAH